MPIAITLRLDPISANAIETMWRILADEGIDDDRIRLGYPAHITLAILAGERAADRIVTRVADCIAGWTALPIRFCGFGLFSPAILWAAPVVTAALLARHTDLLTMLNDFDVDPYYRIGAWVPHVTLAESLEQPGPALAALSRQGFPIEGRIDRVEVVRFRPIEILQSYALPT